MYANEYIYTCKYVYTHVDTYIYSQKRIFIIIYSLHLYNKYMSMHVYVYMNDRLNDSTCMKFSYLYEFNHCKYLHNQTCVKCPLRQEVITYA